MNFNPEKIFSGIWIIPIFGFTFVPGRAGRKRNRGRLLLRQFGEIGSQNRNVHLLDLSVLGFCVYTPGN